MTERLLHHEALVALEAADYALAHVPTLAIQEPHEIDTVTQEWIGPLLSKAVPGAVLEQFTVSDAHDGMTRRKKWSLVWNEIGTAAKLPTSLFIKATPVTPYHRETVSMLHMGTVEVNFYTTLQRELQDISPRAYYARSYLGGRYIVVMEDIEARGLKPYWLAYECSIEHAYAVARAQARLHSTYWRTPRFDTDLRWVRPRTVRYGWDWLSSSFADARRRILALPESERFTSQERSLIGLWDRNCASVYAHWETLPATVLHGDTHLGNTFSHPDGSAGYFDWQLIFRGPGVRDLAMFLTSALSDEQRRKHERAIVDSYLGCLIEAGINIEPERLWREYQLFVFDALDAYVKTIAGGGYGHASSGLERVRQSICGAVADHDAAGLLNSIVRNGRL